MKVQEHPLLKLHTTFSKIIDGTMIPTQGLCAVIGDNIRYEYESCGDTVTSCIISQICTSFRNMMSEWEHYSGNAFYPVPAKNPPRKFDKASISGRLYRGKYGKKRKNLVKYLIGRIESNTAQCTTGERWVAVDPTTDTELYDFTTRSECSKFCRFFGLKTKDRKATG